MHIQDRLFSWGRGKSIRNAPNGYPSIAPFAQSIVNPGDQIDGAEVTPLAEEDHARLDAIISELKIKKPLHHKVICMAYIGSALDVDIARSLRAGRESIKAVREQAEAWIDSRDSES